jgi:uncharacterized protein (TIGR03437 family)
MPVRCKRTSRSSQPYTLRPLKYRFQTSERRDVGHKDFNLALLVWFTLLAATVCHAQPTITTTQLPAAQLNLPYNATFNATGGTPPYSWSIVAGSLPPGMSLSPGGAISGTSAGPSSGFTVQVTDANFPSSMPAQGFFFIGFCSATVSPSSQGHTFEDPGGSDVLTVNSPCGGLTPGATVPWINITGTVNGDGFDSVNIAVAPNATPATRTGNVTFTFNQVSPVLVLSDTITQYAKLRFSTPSPLPLGEVGVPYSVVLQATGGSGIGRSFAASSGSLPPGLGLSGATIGGTPTVPGVSSFTAQVTDQDGFSSAPFSGNQNYALTIVPPLTVTAMSLPGGIAGQSYSAALVATGGVAPISWSLASGALPAGLFLNAATGVISGTPANNAQGSSIFTIRAIDSAGVVSSTPFQINVDPPPLVIQTSSLTPATEGVPYGTNLTASGGIPPYSWSAAGLPSWLTLSAAGQLSGTPPVGSAGPYTFTISAQDSASRFTGVSFTLQVNPGAPSITTTSPLPHAKETTQVSIAFQVSGGVAPYIWTATGLPAFLNLSGGGFLNGTPPLGSVGSVSFPVTVTDAAGKSATGTFTLPIDPVLSITTASSLQATQGQAFTATFTASGGTTPYSFSATGLPGWATMSSGGTVSGTPSRGSAGGSAFTVVALDAAGHTSRAPFTLTVLAPNGGLTLTTPSPLPTGGAANYYQATFVATGGMPPYRWSGSGIPDGLTLSSAGLLSGAPSTAGDDTITAQVTDSNGSVAFQALDLRVTAATLRIVTPSPLVAGEVSVSYSVAFQSEGGARPLVWSASGPLPAGMMFDATGLLNGTPTAPGDFGFTAHVTDSTGATASATYEVLVRPFGPDLVVSAGGLAFTAVRGAAPPPVQTVSVISTMHDSIPFTASADAPWITLAASGATPGRIDVSVDQTGLAAGGYTGTITVSSPNRAAVLIKVALTVKDAPGVLQASPAELDFFSDGTSASPSQNIYVRNSGQGSLNFTVSTDVPWLSVSPATGTVSPNAGAILVAAIDTAKRLAPGVLSGNIEIDSSNGTARIPVSLLISVKPKMILSSAGILLRARQGNGVSGASPASFTVSSSNGNAISFTTQQIGGEGWLQTSGTTAGTVFFNATSGPLQQGAYYALIRVTSPDAFNSPQDFVVVLNVLDAASPPVPNPVPSGLVFTSSGNQNVTVFTSSDQPAPYQVAVSTQSGTGWLSASPTSGTLSTTAPAQLTIAVNGANLKPGVYTGSVNVSISNLAVRTVNVTFIVPASSSDAGLTAALADTPKATCAPANLIVIPTSLEGNFSTPAAWPRTVAAQLADDCGNPVPSGRVVAEFSNGDPPLSLNLSDNKAAVYSSTWTPTHAATQLRVTANASASGLPPASTQILGAVNENVAPILAKNGTLHNLYPQPGAPLAPGTIVQIFGSGLAATTGGTNIPLPTVLNGTSVLIGGELAPLYFVSSGQINAQIPVDLLPGQEYQVLVVANNAYTTPDAIHIAPVTPGIARLANGQVIAQHADFSLVSEDAPAKPGEFLVAYLAGMGLTDNPVGTGAQAPSSPLAAVNSFASVAVDGEAASVLFAGLTPGFIGLYQINFQVPADAQSGDRKLEIFQGGVAANTSVLPVAQ